jgi:surfeit locus 1 family protein
MRMPFRAPMPVVVAAIALVTAGLIALGVWQLQRNDWKAQLVAERNARLEQAPADVAALADEPAAAADWRRVTATGTWDHEHTMTVTNRVRFGRRGEEVVTPLLLGGGRPALLVNRGWYPLDQRERVLAELAAEPGATVVGLARAAGDGGAHTIPSGAWNRLDAPAMADALPYPALPWLMIQGRMVESFEAGDGALPVRQYLSFRNTTPHIQYALTWFGLATALVVVACFRFVIAPRRERTPPGGGAHEPSHDTAAARRAARAERRT